MNSVYITLNMFMNNVILEGVREEKLSDLRLSCLIMV